MTDNGDAELLRLGERLRKVMREVAVKRAAYEALEERITAAVDRSAPWPSNDDELGWTTCIVEQYAAAVDYFTSAAGAAYKRACSDLNCASEQLDAVVEAILAEKPTSLGGLGVWAAVLRDAYGELWRQSAENLEHQEKLLRRFLEHTTAMATKEQPELIVPDMPVSEPLETALSDMECLSAAAH